MATSTMGRAAVVVNDGVVNPIETLTEIPGDTERDHLEDLNALDSESDEEAEQPAQKHESHRRRVQNTIFRNW